MMSREGITGLSIVYLPEEQKDADEVKAHIEGYEQSKGVKVNLIPADLSKPGDDEVKMILKKHIEAFGERVDILVNNAAQVRLPFLSCSPRFLGSSLRVFAVERERVKMGLVR
jgi:NAD(P)-dependent dehydrogenase (short-subunit alcohol dehydrogenase family)